MFSILAILPYHLAISIPVVLLYRFRPQSCYLLSNCHNLVGNML